MDETYKLCYVSEQWAYFTTRDVEEQWGDDWNDAPYEHNAGRPYGYKEYMAEKGVEPYEVDKVAFDGADMETPCSYAFNSPYAVMHINRGVVPWLQTDRFTKTEERIKIWAGCPFPEFVELIEKAGGRVYT